MSFIAKSVVSFVSGGPGLVYELQLDFLEAQGLEESVLRCRARRQRVAVCLPRILKPNEAAGPQIWGLGSHFWRRFSKTFQHIPRTKKLQDLIKLLAVSSIGILPVQYIWPNCHELQVT